MQIILNVQEPNKLERIQVDVSQACKEVLKNEKSVQRKTIGAIIEELVMKEYCTLFVEEDRE